MSKCANIFVNFTYEPPRERIHSLLELISNRTQVPVSDDEIYGRLVKCDENVFVDNNGQIKFTDSGPYGSHYVYQISYLTRYWSTTYPEGEIMVYALTLLTLLDQNDVQNVWYSDDDYRDYTLPCLDAESIHGLINDFVRVGETTSGELTRHIHTEDGVISV